MGGVDIPQTDTCFEGKHVLIVVREIILRKTLAVMKTYIDEMKPVLVGVDGGADAHGVWLQAGCCNWRYGQCK